MSSAVQSEETRTDLDEANVGGLLTEALTADVEAILADQTGGMGADAAVVRGKKKKRQHFFFLPLNCNHDDDDPGFPFPSSLLLLFLNLPSLSARWWCLFGDGWFFFPYQERDPLP